MNQATNPEQRRLGVGGSDLPKILGLRPGIVELCKIKQGLTDAQPLDQEYVYWGSALEDICADEFVKRTGKQLRRVNKTIIGDNGWERANIDRRVVGEKVPYEGKTTNAFNREWMQDVSQDALSQCQWYMGITQSPYCYVSCLIGGQQYVIHRVDFDEPLYQAIWDKAKEFWDHVTNGTLPEPDCLEDLDSLYKGGAGRCGSDHATRMAVQRLQEIKQSQKLQQKEIKELELEIKKYMGDHEILMSGDKAVASWKWQERRTIDAKELRVHHPELAEQFTRVSETRIFRLK